MNKKYKITTATMRALWAIRNRGIIVTLATGRNEWEARSIVSDLGIDSSVILCNGAQIFDFRNEELLYGDTLVYSDVVAYLLEYTDSRANVAWYNCKWETLTAQSFVNIDIYPIIKRLILELPSGGTLPSSEGSPFFVFRNGDSKYELTPRSAEKGDGLQRLCELLDVLPEEVLAIGNDLNDLSMLKVAGMGLAIGDAHEELKKVADGILAPIDQDPIVSVERWLSGQMHWDDMVV